MLGLVMAVLWLMLFLALSVRWDSTGAQAVRSVKKGDGLHVDLNMPVHPGLKSLPMLLIGIGLAPFWFIFGNNCTLTIPPAHVAAVYDPLRGGIQNDVLPEGFHIV